MQKADTPPHQMHLADEKANESLHEHAGVNGSGTATPVSDDYPGKGTDMERKLVRKVGPVLQRPIDPIGNPGLTVIWREH
jgi:hypothetical protein